MGEKADKDSLIKSKHFFLSITISSIDVRESETGKRMFRVESGWKN